MGYCLCVYSPSAKEAQEKVTRQSVAEGRGVRFVQAAVCVTHAKEAAEASLTPTPPHRSKHLCLSLASTFQLALSSNCSDSVTDRPMSSWLLTSS